MGSKCPVPRASFICLFECEKSFRTGKQVFIEFSKCLKEEENICTALVTMYTKRKEKSKAKSKSYAY